MNVGAFTFESPSVRVIFGPGKVTSVAEQTDLLGAKKIFLIAARNATGATHVEQALGQLLVGRWYDVAQHVPVELVDRAWAAVEQCGADCIVTVGGGSATGLAKAVVRNYPVPLIAVPTTYAGSEMTSIYGLTDGDRKLTNRDPRAKPAVVVYDPELTTGLAPAVTGPSAFNALAHCVAALGSPAANPVTTALALEAVKWIRECLPNAIGEPSDLPARTGLQLGAFLAGTALATAGTGLNHRICHVLGGMLNLSHADTHSVVLPHIVALNAPALPEQMGRLAQALGHAAGDPAEQLWDLAVRCGVATDLRRLGARPEDLRAAAERIAVDPNPRAVTRADIEELLTRALSGERPHIVTRPTSQLPSSDSNLQKG